MRILLYSPELAGHYQVYCRVLSRTFLDAGHEVTLASPAMQNDWMRRWVTLAPLVDEARLTCLDLRIRSTSGDGRLTAEEMVGLQRESRADATLFIQADSFKDQFRRIAAGTAPRLHGRVCAIFARTSEWCPGEEAYGGEAPSLVGPTVRRTLANLKQKVTGWRESPRYFFEHVMLKHRLVDALIVKDERIIGRYGSPVVWMPEIYRVYDLQPGERRAGDWERFAEPIGDFIRKAGPENVLLYFGAAAWYKGYDTLLDLAVRDNSCVVLHAGALDPRESGRTYAHDVDGLRDKLLKQNRLFETQSFVESADLVSLVFDSIERFVSTHRLTLSSGTVLQALECGKPVLTPHSGLVGWRTRTSGTGMTYQYGDAGDLALQWAEFRKSPVLSWQPAIQKFMPAFSRQHIETFFNQVITGTT